MKNERRMVNFQGLLVLAAMLLPVTCAAITAVAMLDANVRSAVAVIALATPYLLITVSVVAILYGVGRGATDIARRWNERTHVYPNANGLYPLVRTRGKRLDWFDATPDAVKAVAAWTHAQAAHGLKPTSNATKAAMSILHGQAESMPALPEPRPVPASRPHPSAFNLADIDPVTRPHWLLVGQTGSGKSTAVRTITSALARRHAVEFVICEPGGVDWNSQANAYSDSGIARAVAAVYTEFERRQALLRDSDAAHISALESAIPYLYLVIEEMEAVLDNLKDLDRDAALTMRVQLRNIARMGRKEGVGLIAVTQVAKADVFDTHVRSNLANVFLFRNAQGVAEMFRLGRQVDLPSLPPGVAYSMAHEQLVQFHPVPRPILPLSPVFHEDGANRWAQPVATTPQPDFSGYQPVVLEIASTAHGDNGHGNGATHHIERGRAPTAAEAAEMRQMYRRGASLNRICFATYGYKDDVVLAYVREATGYEAP